MSIKTKDDGVLAGNKTVLLSLTGDGTGVDRQPERGGAEHPRSAVGGHAAVRHLDRERARGDTVRVTVVRTGSNLVGTVSAGWAATGGTATADVDFTPSSGTLTFGPGVTRQSFDLTATDDGIPEGTERIVLSLSSPTGGAALK